MSVPGHISGLSISYPLVKRLQDPTDEEIDQVVQVLIDAFKGDPFSDILMGLKPDLNPRQLRANLMATLIGGEVHVLTVGENVTDIVGVALWFPPGFAVFSSEEQRAAGWNQFLEFIPESLQKWWLEQLVPTIGQLHAKSFRPNYVLDSWHLHLFGVMKAHHRRGYGKALIKYVENKAKETHSALVLETTNEVDVTIYKRLGFHVCGEADIVNSIPGGNDAHIWAMSKETQELWVNVD